ncbi:hypothetical protein ACFO25_08225 [Paenactinomyces guangxiensis]|uniref:Uncharacterized protein n=1 Tax=Paenactinomyces guangxiensis TaxID=1490290 RepID=A0A7W1WN41_9BACL|nr:hypothetical protein [Paenactinomyces guangxiensis]MBA4492970.1 hypothetical protein [Paenactinomyces guangxiensis]MBH8590181.1 hypothetical protein [Paenactinomyces guangxiensis]
MDKKETKGKIRPNQTSDTEIASELYEDAPTQHVTSAIQEMYSQAGISKREEK